MIQQGAPQLDKGKSIKYYVDVPLREEPTPKTHFEELAYTIFQALNSSVLELGAHSTV